MKISKVFLALFAIVILAGFLRFYKISSVSPSLGWDEAALGYNAYSLGVDGKDEFGRKFPFDYIESFGDFKPPLYSYLDVVPVKIFGLNEFGIRFPSALFGTFSVLLTFFVVKQIFNKTGKLSKENVERAALLSSLFLAISPWHVMLSRAAFEANVASFFIILGVLFFLLAINRKPIVLILSGLSFALSFYTFNSARVFVPIFILTIAIVFAKELVRIKKEVILSSVIGFAILIPLASFLLSPQAGLRYKEVNIFSDPNLIKISNQEIANDGNTIFAKTIHNRRVYFAREYLKHYLDNLSPTFLFIKGDGNPRFSIQDVGEMYLWDLPFFLLGFLFLFKKREGFWIIIPLWLLLGIVPSAFARETPHALRIESTLPTFQILTAYGLVWLVAYIKRYKKLIFGFFGFLLLLNVFYFLHGLFLHYAREYSSEWQYAYKLAVPYLEKEKSKYDKVYFTDELGRPYIFFLAYGKTSPEEFRKTSNVSREALGFVHVNSLGKYEFLQDVKNKEPELGNNLFVDVPQRVPDGVNIQKIFYLLDGTPSLIVYTFR